ncbi:MAG: ubiquinol-cytochrome C chaperone [Hyphomicrobiaceae bacterium]|nr:ubiquinol-cytochrome C chaperone [Hyphomicrobiaceae bacterium]
MTAARRQPFYVRHGVPDTPDGRFAMVVMHMCLVLERLRREGPRGQDLSRALVEAFVTDMDDCMREMGVGDLAVPRKVKKAAGALYDCAAAFRAAGSASGEAALADALQRSLLPEQAGATADGLAAYMRRAAAALEVQPAAVLLSGRITFAQVRGE